MENIEKLTWTVEEAAKLLGCSRNLAYTLCRQDKFPGVIKLGDKRMVISKIALQKYLECNIEKNDDDKNPGELDLKER